MEEEIIDFDFQSQLENRKEKIRGISRMKFDEEFHTKDRAGWSIDLYLELDRFIMGLRGQVKKEYLESYIKYSYNGLLFCYILLRKKETLRFWAKIPYTSLGSVPLFVRDYEPTSRRVGVMITFDDQREFIANKEAMLEVSFNIIKKAFQGIVDRKRKVKTPLKPAIKVEPVKPIEIFRPFSIDIIVNGNGDMSITLKLKKDQKELLNRILQETILK